MMKGVKPLDFGSIGQGADDASNVQQTEPAPDTREPGRLFSAKDLASPSREAQEANRLSSFPSREPRPALRTERVQKMQINSYMDPELGEAFKDLCERERYSYGDMIGILLKSYLEKHR